MELLTLDHCAFDNGAVQRCSTIIVFTIGIRTCKKKKIHEDDMQTDYCSVQMKPLFILV